MSHPPTWTPKDPPLTRFLRSILAPPIAAGAVFVCSVVIAVMIVLARPEAPPEPTSGVLEHMTEPSNHAASTDNATETTVIVHVAGAVQAPGVVELESGARVETAIEAAGGVTEHAVLEGVNLARPVIDGEQIVVPDETTNPGAHGTEALVPGKLNLNQANLAELETLPGIGPALASRIIEWRERNGGYSRVDDLLEVSGIGEKLLANIADLVVAP